MNHVIKNGDLFLLTDEKGNIPDKHGQGWGLYCGDTRFMSRMEWAMEGSSLQWVSGEAEGAESHYRFRQEEKEGGLEVDCHRWIHAGLLFERWTLKNHTSELVEQTLSFRFQADFTHRSIIQKRQEETCEGNRMEIKTSGLRFSCHGTDGVERALEIQLSPSPTIVTEEKAVYTLPLASDGKQVVELCYIPMIEEREKTVPLASEALADMRHARKRWMESCPHLESDDEDLTALYHRGLNDLGMLLTHSGEGMVPWAGLPWNGVIHGRESLIAAWQSLIVQPDVAKAVIRTLARYQGRKEDRVRGEEPGKIMGELQSPIPDYFHVESTPLFLILLAEWHQWIGDDDFLREMLPHVRKAMNWMDRRAAEGGGRIMAPVHHGWRHALDRLGREEEEAVAWVDVQGYAVQAKQAWSRVFHYLGNLEDARSLSREAKAWTKRLILDFWQEESRYFATVRNDEGILPMVTGSPGHLLLAGILDQAQAEGVAKRLLKPDLFSGWGIRTLSTEDSDYRPFNPHQGCVWPHDTAWIAAGMIDMGLREAADPLIRALLDASRTFPGHRLPEFFAGHSRNNNKPIPAPSACSLHSASSGSIFALLRAMTGLRPDVPRRVIRLSPHLPEGVGHLCLNNIRVGKGTLDIRLRRWGTETYVRVDNNTTGCRVVIS